MAALGRREMKKHDNRPETPQIGLASPAVNLIASPIKVQPVATLDIHPSAPGGPIMRGDFITRTSPMFSEPD